jgi:hypothetical protein
VRSERLLARQALCDGLRQPAAVDWRRQIAWKVLESMHMIEAAAKLHPDIDVALVVRNEREEFERLFKVALGTGGTK